VVRLELCHGHTDAVVYSHEFHGNEEHEANLPLVLISLSTGIKSVETYI
jgi:hypothetical protein